MQISYMTLNVSSLAKRLEAITSLGCDFVVLTEVRASASQQPSLSRRAKALGYTCVWSAPPPASNTFETPPGGVAIMAKDKHTLRKIRSEEVHCWHEVGRALAAILIIGSSCVCIVGVYGFAASNREHDMNEVLLTQLGCWVARLKMPALLLGDFNQNTSSSAFLNLCDVTGLWRLSSNEPTTSNRKGQVAETLPLDHVMANARMLDFTTSAQVDYSVHLSDHYPIRGELRLPVVPVSSVWKWPRKMEIPDTPVENVEWVFEGSTYTEWADCAVRWLAKTFSISPCYKTRFVTQDIQAKSVAVDPRYECFNRALGLLQRLCETHEHAPTGKLCEYLHKLDLEPQASNEDTRAMVIRVRDAYLKEKQDAAIAAWKRKVRTWTVRTKDIFLFLRNQPPAKPIAIKDQEGHPRSQPAAMTACLESFWEPLENWHDQQQHQLVRSVLEDKYSLFLPHVPFSVSVDVKTFKSTLGKMSPTVPGPDGWCLQELRALPKGAIRDLLNLLNSSSDRIILNSTLGWFKRVPLEKPCEDVPLPSQIRPIDVYSCILRAYTSAQTSLLRPWLTEVLHVTQYATAGGAQKALALVNVYAELTLSLAVPVWALSVDLQKMFNLLSESAATDAAMYMGLDTCVAQQVKAMIRGCKGVWRLPHNMTGLVFRRSKGLPQGLSTSVCLAEICVAVLLHRLHAIVSVTTICYVDDLNIIAHAPELLCAAIECLLEFVADFCLSLSREKSALWGTDPAGLKAIGERYGLVESDRITTLGMTWGLRPSSDPSSPKEEERIKEASLRLARLTHLSLPTLQKAKVIVIGCLSLLQYAPILQPTKVESLKGPVRRALGQCHGTPEILFSVLHPVSLDPLCAWLIASCRLICHWASERPGTLELINLSRRNSRLGAFVKQCKKFSWSVRPDWLEFPDETRLRWLVRWPMFRDEFVKQFRRASLKCAVTRRPNFYAGLEDVHVKKHMTLLAEQPPHATSVLLRVWCGCAMTAQRKHMLDPAVSEECQCGAECQSIEHLLYHCPLVSPPDDDMREWSRLPSAFSSALLCSWLFDPKQMEVWERMCKRAIMVLTQHVDIQREHNWKGHFVTFDSTLQVAFCVRCFVSRKVRDQLFVATMECTGDLMGNTLEEGAYMRYNLHLLRLTLRPWKRASLRPALTCIFCKRWAWARNRGGWSKPCLLSALL